MNLLFCPEPAAPCPPPSSLFSFLLFCLSSPCPHSRQLGFSAFCSALVHTEKKGLRFFPGRRLWAPGAAVLPSQWQPSLRLAFLLFLLPALFLSPQVHIYTRACARTHSCLLPPVQLPLSTPLPLLLPVGVTEHPHSPQEGDPPQAPRDLPRPSSSTQEPTFPTMKVGSSGCRAAPLRARAGPGYPQEACVCHFHIHLQAERL